MKNNFLILLLLFMGFGIQSKAQEKEKIYTAVEEAPIFPGGEDKMIRFLAKNIEYPTKAKVEGLKGIVYVEFVIHSDGSISNSKIVQDIGGGCGEEVLKAIDKMPRWKPGAIRGKPVASYYTLPVAFERADDTDEQKQTEESK